MYFILLIHILVIKSQVHFLFSALVCLLRFTTHTLWCEAMHAVSFYNKYPQFNEISYIYIFPSLNVGYYTNEMRAHTYSTTFPINLKRALLQEKRKKVQWMYNEKSSLTHCVCTLIPMNRLQYSRIRIFFLLLWEKYLLTYACNNS